MSVTCRSVGHFTPCINMMSTSASPPPPPAGRGVPRTRTVTRPTRRQAAATPSGGSQAVLLGAKENLLACLQAKDDQGVQAAISELIGMTPTEAPARSAMLQGKWRLVWCKQDDSANFFQKAFSGLPNYNVINGNNSLENIVEAGPRTLNARATCAAVSDNRLDVRITEVDIFVGPWKAKTIEITPTPGKNDGWVEQLYLDDNMRISAGTRDSMFVHCKGPGYTT